MLSLLQLMLISAPLIEIKKQNLSESLQKESTHINKKYSLKINDKYKAIQQFFNKNNIALLLIFLLNFLHFNIYLSDTK